jgi:phage I-like protein
MNVNARQELDALDLLLQSHREIESLIRKFEYIQKSGGDTEHVIDNACAELELHDALETGILHAALSEAVDDDEIDGLLDEARTEHDAIRGFVGKIRQARPDQREAQFALLAGRVQIHVLSEESKLFPRLRDLKQLDLGPMTAVMRKRNTQMIADMEFPATATVTV